MSTDKVADQPIEVEAGASLTAINDKVLLGLMDYFAFWIKRALDAKLRVQTPTSPDACPVGNRFPWDPSTYFVQNKFPALYCWSGPSKSQQFTIYKWARIREINLMLVFDEIVGPSGITVRHGLIPAAEAAVMTANYRGNHPEYSYDGDDLGTPIWQTLDLLAFKFISSEEGHMSPVPEIDARSNQGSGFTVRYYPALICKFEVTEELEEHLITPSDIYPLLGSGTIDLELTYQMSSDNSSVTSGSAFYVNKVFKTIPLTGYSSV